MIRASCQKRCAAEQIAFHRQQHHVHGHPVGERIGLDRLIEKLRARAGVHVFAQPRAPALVSAIHR